MANVIITLKLMPSSPETDLAKVTEEAKSMIEATEAIVHKVEEKPVAFGLNAIEIMFSADEAKGSTDALEESIAAMEEVNSCEVIDVRRAVG